METNRIVAGLDVHKDTIFLCIMGHDGSIIFQKKYRTLTPELHRMRDDMVMYGVMEAAMESTATYWVPVWNVLCSSMSLKLVNPYFIKQLPGRKSDVKDAQWITECLLKNLLKDSFVPGPAVQDMRKYNRRIFDLNDDMVSNTNKLDAALLRCGFRLSNYEQLCVAGQGQELSAVQPGDIEGCDGSRHTGRDGTRQDGQQARIRDHKGRSHGGLQRGGPRPGPAVHRDDRHHRTPDKGVSGDPDGLMRRTLPRPV